MKIIHVWEPEDIIHGNRYTRAGIDEIWMLGYVVGRAGSIVSVSLLDGMVTQKKTVLEMVEMLNSERYVPTDQYKKEPF